MSSAALSIAAPGRAAAAPLTGWERLKLDRMAMIALAVLALIVGLKRVSRKIPGALIAVIGALVVSLLVMLIPMILAGRKVDHLEI